MMFMTPKPAIARAPAAESPPDSASAVCVAPGGDLLIVLDLHVIRFASWKLVPVLQQQRGRRDGGSDVGAAVHPQVDPIEAGATVQAAECGGQWHVDDVVEIAIGRLAARRKRSDHLEVGAIQSHPLAHASSPGKSRAASCTPSTATAAVDLQPIDRRELSVHPKHLRRPTEAAGDCIHRPAFDAAQRQQVWDLRVDRRRVIGSKRSGFADASAPRQRACACSARRSLARRARYGVGARGQAREVSSRPKCSG
jgi:hypothetical protein